MFVSHFGTGLGFGGSARAMPLSALAAASGRGQPRLRVCEGGRWKRGREGVRRGMCEGTSASSAVASSPVAPSPR